MKYQTYPSYSAPDRVSGIAYPRGWRVERLRFSILSNPVRSEVGDWDDQTLVSFVPMDAVGELGGMDVSQERSIGDVYNGYTYFAEKDIVIANTFRKLGESEMYGAGGQKRVPEDFVRNFRLGIPDVEEQQQIVKFLDWKMRQIDRLTVKGVTNKLLTEYRTALITAATTGKIDLRGWQPDTVPK